jgi:hypothetical protein
MSCLEIGITFSLFGFSVRGFEDLVEAFFLDQQFPDCFQAGEFQQEHEHSQDQYGMKTVYSSDEDFLVG